MDEGGGGIATPGAGFEPDDPAPAMSLPEVLLSLALVLSDDVAEGS